ncbi:hypothetical protein P692DRAFT_20877321 [Suillus brevipes Sb2]|nr:hypothetical protein P692DRAFT_20877321 [Suillus brevipes Sb2]
MASLHLLCVPSKFQAIIPSRTLSVTQLLVFELLASLKTNPSCTGVVLSQEPPKVQLPADFISQSVPAFSTATALCDHATSAWQDGDQSIMHLSFPNDPLPLWVLSYWVSMSHALEHQHVIERLPWDVPLKGVGAQTDLSTSGLRLLLASGPIGGRLMDTMIAAVVERMQASQNGDLQTVCVESLILMDTLHLSEKRWANYETEKAFTRLHTIGSALHEGTLQHVLFPINS